MTHTYINISAGQDAAAAPLFEIRGGDSMPMPAFIELDTVDGEISFGIRPERNSISGAEADGRVRRWQVPAELRGSYLPTLAEHLQPLLQRVQAGASEAADGKTRLTVDATAAEEEIDGLLMGGSGGRSLIDYSDTAQIIEMDYAS